jgi:hypothetical protein
MQTLRQESGCRWLIKEMLPGDRGGMGSTAQTCSCSRQGCWTLAPGHQRLSTPVQVDGSYSPREHLWGQPGREAGDGPQMISVVTSKYLQVIKTPSALSSLRLQQDSSQICVQIRQQDGQESPLVPPPRSGTGRC